MENQCTVQVKLELGHRAQLRKKVTSEGFTHDWMVYVRGPETCDIQHFVDKVVFRLHESFPKPKRVCKEPPYKVEESGYAGFLMPIEVYFKNREEPKKVFFNYDLFLNLEGNPPVNHLRCEKLTFNNPTKDFRRKLIKAGGVMVVPDVAEAVSRPSPDYPMLPTIPLSAFSDPKKTKASHVSKDPSKDGSGSSSKGAKPHKLTKEHRERPRKDSESKATSKGDNERDGSCKSGRDPSSSSSSSSKKPSEIKVKEEVKVVPKAAFKEPKLTLKESKMEGMSPKGGGAGSGGGGGGGGGGGPAESKAPGKRPSTVESPKLSTKKQKKASSEGSKGPTGGTFTGTSPRVSSSASSQPYSEKKSSKDKGRWAKVKGDTQDIKEPKKLPESEESNSDDEASSKSEQSAPSSPSNSSSSSDSSSDSDFEPGQKPGQGPLRSMVEEIQSEESDDDDSSSEEETPIKTNPPNRDSRLSLDSESDSSDGSHRPSRDTAPPPQKHSSSNNKVLGRKSPDSSFRSEKLKKGYDKVGRAYTEELVDLHRRLMALRERNVLQQIVNLIEETGHFNVTNTTFDFDLFSLDESTVRKLQSYLEATAT
ncbi:protein ENL isoform X1 [Synchiropus splendidus]|uniref:protein ENL isoform X1 n=1 Tax=Synchiropus splendidus TaxID=270530 RepID=UPI00237EBD01|nr:protein ENL isoform X1 [Synchiropus splendidus]